MPIMLICPYRVFFCFFYQVCLLNIFIYWYCVSEIWTMEFVYLDDKCYISGWRLHIWTIRVIYLDAFNSLRPRQNGRYNADDIFKRIFLYENVWFPTKISLNFVPKGPTNNIQALVLIMAWHRSGDKPLSEPMMVSLPTHICVTRPQWVN